MLPAQRRLRRPAQFSQAMRQGSRRGRQHLVVHLYRGQDAPMPSQVGIVVSKAVGNSVVRHRVSRRLRHVLRERLPQLDFPGLLVVRATPSSAQAGSAALAADIDAALAALLASPPARTGVSHGGDDD